MRLKWTPDEIVARGLGSVSLAVINSLLNSKTTPIAGFFKNGDLSDWLIIGGDLFNAIPDGTTLGTALDAAADAAIYDLTNNLLTSRLLPLPFTGGIPLLGGGATTLVPATPAAAAAMGAPSPTSAGTPIGPTPIPSASMSAAGDVSVAGY